MPQETYHFSCPVCGMHAPVDRLYTEEPFLFRMFRKLLGGKIKLTEAEREARRGTIYEKQGSGHGGLEYDEVDMDEEVRHQLEVRLEEIAEGGFDWITKM